MGLEILLYTGVFLVLLGLSAFFSGSETAYFSLSQSILDQFRSSDQNSEQRVADLMTDPPQFLITIVVGNTMVNITIASLAAILTTRLSDSFGLHEMTYLGINGSIIAIFIDVFVVTLVILISSEIIPKVVAIRNARAYARATSGVLKMIYHLFYIVTNPLSIFSRKIQSLGGLSEDKTMLSEAELKALVEVGEEHGALQKDEKEMINSIFEFGETTVKEIMVPRTDMVCIETGFSLSQLMELVKAKLLSRIPVYKDRIDNIVGILYVKDLLPLLSKRRRETLDLKRIVRPPYFVPEQKKIHDLLREFQKERKHMALVVDEYGGVSGLVTLEDVIEEIVGEIQDEYDKESPLFEKVDDHTFMVDGRMPIEELNDELHMNLPTEEGVETISGFILNILGSLPKEKEVARYNGYRFTVESINRNRIRQVRIQKKPSHSVQE